MATTHIYAGAGMWRGGKRPGVFRMKLGNGGFEQLRNGLPDPVSVHAITVHPNDPSLVLIGTQDGIYRSTDHGNTWTRADFPDQGVQIWSILVHPGAPQTIIAGAAPVALYRSDDSGEHWRCIARPDLPVRVKMDFPCRVMRLAIDAKKPDEIFAIVEVNGVMRSRDGGESWTDCSAGLIRLAAEQQRYKSKLGSDNEAEGMLDGHAICVSAADPGAVYIAIRMGLFRSGDGGDTWQDMDVGRFSPLTYARDIRPAPQDPRIFYACLSVHSMGDTGSLCRSRDLGQSWERIDHGVNPAGTLMYMALNPRDAEQVYGVARRGQVIGTQDDGKTWHEYKLPEGTGDCYTVACG